jgi:hypothetical protein
VAARVHPGDARIVRRDLPGRTKHPRDVGLSEEGNFEVLAALGAILLVITVAIAALGFRVIGRDFMVRSGQ